MFRRRDYFTPEQAPLVADLVAVKRMSTEALDYAVACLVDSDPSLEDAINDFWRER